MLHSEALQGTATDLSNERARWLLKPQDLLAGLGKRMEITIF
jgi:hypothetical protein